MREVVGGVLKDFGFDRFELRGFCSGDVTGVCHAFRDGFGEDCG